MMNISMDSLFKWDYIGLVDDKKMRRAVVQIMKTFLLIQKMMGAMA